MPEWRHWWLLNRVGTFGAKWGMRPPETCNNLSLFGRKESESISVHIVHCCYNHIQLLKRWAKVLDRYVLHSSEIKADKGILGKWSWISSSESWSSIDFKSQPNISISTKGRVVLPNCMNFRKNSNRPSTPPHFQKIMLQISYDRYGCIYARRYDEQIVWNACTWFPEKGTIQRVGGRWGSTAARNLSQNSSDLVAWPVPLTFTTLY